MKKNIIIVLVLLLATCFSNLTEVKACSEGASVPQRYTMIPVNLSEEEYIIITGIGEVYFRIDIEGSFSPTTGASSITTTVTKIGHGITNTYYNSTGLVFYSSAIKKWVYTTYNNDYTMTIQVRVEVTIFNEVLGPFTAAQTFSYLV